MVREAEVASGDRHIRYLEAGAGWPVLLLHAFPLTANMWEPQLDSVPDGFRFIAPDLAGFGGSSPLPAAPTMDGYADDVAALLDRLEIERATIGGLSMGGYVTFALYRKAPERFLGVVLANTRPQADTPEGRDGRMKMRQLVNERGVGAVADQMMPKLLGETTRRHRAGVESRVRALIESNTASAVAAALQAMMQRPDSTPELAKIGRPTLIIAGDEDTLIPRADAETMNTRIARSRLIVLDAAGHLSNMEVPDEFSAALADFLTSNL
jgi:pimeloyl-ACP methyl ester carboxylesterase